MNTEFKSALATMFGAKKPEQPALTPSEQAPALSEKKSYVTRDSIIRGLGNPLITAQAQKIYDPSVPTPPISPPTGPMASVGTGPAIGGGKDASGWTRVQ